MQYLRALLNRMRLVVRRTHTYTHRHTHIHIWVDAHFCAYYPTDCGPSSEAHAQINYTHIHVGRCAFCAYCQTDCGSSSEAHTHVARCAWNTRKEVFSRQERFEEAQHQRRSRLVRTSAIVIYHMHCVHIRSQGFTPCRLRVIVQIIGAVF